MADGAVEIITGRERRRRWSVEDKLKIVGETLEPGASVNQIAARHDVYPGLLFTWRGVRPCGWTESSQHFDRLAGVLILKLGRAEIAKR
ncbi:transposase [Rhodopila sp.]|uniref:transposase n=1 Tax=Rhodopila sp. TaxID=2480087 RepID=UPI003D134384